MPGADVLLRSVLDYAGTFPPAALELSHAVEHYSRARSGPHAWMLGRFILPASQLEAFDDRIARMASTPSAQRWPVNVVTSGSTAELQAIGRYLSRSPERATVEAVECGPLPVSDINRVMEQIPRGVEAFFEVPVDSDMRRRLDTIAAAAALSKIRTGGLTPEAFPSVTDLAGFMRASADAGVAFKATAGLHHALRGRYAQTAAPDSKLAEMHGFLNVAVAAVLVHMGAASSEVADALQESAPGAFDFSGEGLAWNGRRIGVAEMAAMRRDGFRSFGSCVFDESVEELERVRIL